MTEFQEIRTFTIECPNPDCLNPSDVKRAGEENGEPQYRCNTCNKIFSTGSAMYKQFSVKQAGLIPDLYHSGMSYKQIAEHLERHHDVPEPSKKAMHDGVKGPTIMAQRFLDGKVGPDGREASATGKPIKAKTGDHWVADENEVDVGGEKAWLWNIMDVKTRYIVGAHLSQDREAKSAFKVFEKALAATEKPPKKITTDGLESYKDPIKALFPKGTEHIIGQGITSEINNNLSERLQGTFRARGKTQRGLEMIRTGQDYVDGYVIDYNFFKDHEALDGGVPAEAAGVAEQVPWGDSWEGVIRMGGEVAERKKEQTEPIKRKPGPKPKDPNSLKSAAEEYMDTRQKEHQVEEATKHYSKKDKSPVSSYPPKHRKIPVRRPRGRMRL